MNADLPVWIIVRRNYYLRSSFETEPEIFAGPGVGRLIRCPD